MGGAVKKPTRTTKPAKTKKSEEGPFARVWAIVRQVPKGKVVTYGQLSEMIDRRLTPVGVGWALRAAPEGTIPWQRVVNGQGRISTDRAHPRLGGSAPEPPGLQRAMLEAEGVRFDREGRIDLARYGWKPRVSSSSRP